MKSIRLFAAALCLEALSLAALISLVPLAPAQRMVCGPNGCHPAACASCSPFASGQRAAIFPTFALNRHCPCGVTCPAGGDCGDACPCANAGCVVVTGAGEAVVTIDGFTSQQKGQRRCYYTPPLAPLPAGQVHFYHLSVRLPSGDVLEQDVDVLPGKTTTVQVDLDNRSVSDCGIR